MLNLLFKLFEHKCVLEVCIHIHPIMIKIHPVFFCLNPYFKIPFFTPFLFLLRAPISHEIKLCKTYSNRLPDINYYKFDMVINTETLN